MKGICFKEPLFHATIEGRKTQKRRIIKNTTGTLKPFGNFLRRAVECHYIMIDDNSEKFRPRYKVGEVVYLKELYAYLLKKFAKPGDRILDTHLGSGSICIAAHDLGYEMTGIELDPEYYAAARQRLVNHQMQGRLF